MLACAALVSCAPEPVPTPSPTPTYVYSYETPPPTALAPLTGRTVDVGSLANPSLAAKVDNHPDARPQVGLEHTDIVFEELVEGGITRYVAVWHSDVPEKIGPVRSIRPMDPDIISPLGGIVAYSGGQYRFVVMMRNTPVYNAIHGQPDTRDTFYRSDPRPSPHDVIVMAQQVIAQHSDLAPPPQQFAFSLDTPSSTAAKEGAPVSNIAIKFSYTSKPSWAWNEETGTFLRSQGGDPDMDSAGGRLQATNVVVLRVPVSYGYGLPKTELIGSGEAWVASGGAYVHARWSKGSATSPIRLVDDNGIVVRLAPGNTWIELVPSSGEVGFKAPATS